MDTEGKSTIANKRTSEKKNVINSNGKHNGHPVETAAKNSRHRHEGARNRQRGKQTKNETTAVRLKKKTKQQQLDTFHRVRTLRCGHRRESCRDLTSVRIHRNTRS